MQARWLGSNSGAAGGANGNSGMVVSSPQIAAAAAALSWTAIERVHFQDVTVLGPITAPSLGANTPAAGFVLPADIAPPCAMDNSCCLNVDHQENVGL